MNQRIRKPHPNGPRVHPSAIQAEAARLFDLSTTLFTRAYCMQTGYWYRPEDRKRYLILVGEADRLFRVHYLLSTIATEPRANFYR